jgi:hypothetical protein
MKFLFIFLFFSTEIFSSERLLGLVHSKLFQLTSSEKFQDWIINPAYSKKKFSNQTSFLFSRSNDFLKLYNNLRTKDSQKITSAINSFVGKPHTLIYKIEGRLNKGPHHHSLSYNSGQFLFISPSNPVKVEGLFYNSLVGKWSSKLFFSSLNTVIIPKLIYGIRKTLDDSFTSLELTSLQPDEALARRPWTVFSEFNLLTNLNLKIFNITLNLKSFPLLNRDFIYWSFDTSLQSKKILFPKRNTYFSSFDFFVNYSPLIGGDYKNKKTLRYGMSLNFNRFLNLNIFFLENSNLGFHLEWKNKDLSASLHSYKMLFSNNYLIKKTGLDFNYKF